MSDEAPITNRGGSAPPKESDLTVELRTMFTSLISAEIGKLRTDIVDATSAAAQVAEQLHRFNTNIEAIRHEVQRLNDRMTDAESRISKLEEKSSNPPGAA